MSVLLQILVLLPVRGRTLSHRLFGFQALLMPGQLQTVAVHFVLAQTSLSHPVGWRQGLLMLELPTIWALPTVKAQISLHLLVDFRALLMPEPLQTVVVHFVLAQTSLSHPFGWQGLLMLELPRILALLPAKAQISLSHPFG
jgi:hypothetical protein